MNKMHTDSRISRILHIFFRSVRKKLRVIILFVSAFALLFLTTYFSYMEENGFNQLNLVDFEIGKVAERDVVASREISYVDKNATQIRREARQRLVTAIFRYDRTVSTSILSDYTEFTEFIENLMQNTFVQDQFLLEVQQQYPGMIEKTQLEALFKSPERLAILATSLTIFKQIVNEGVATFPDQGMEKFNHNDVEVIRWKNEHQEQSDVPIESLLTWNDIRPYVVNALVLMKKPGSMAGVIYALVRPFLKDNLLYQSDESEEKLAAAIKQVAPVLVVIGKGQKIIRRGFIISEENYKQLEALAKSGVYIDRRQFTGTILCLLITILIAIYLFTSGITRKYIEFKNVVFLVVMFLIMYLVVLFFSHLLFFSLPLDLAVIIPAALSSILIAVLIDRTSAVLMVFVNFLAILCASGFSLAPALFSLFSGTAGVAVIRTTGKRIDLVKSASILALLQPAIMAVLLIIIPGSTRDVPFAIIGSGINGFMSGILALGFLPILESVLNTSTSFRLMEFSDLNSPVMKKMLVSLSGTYNHSIMVATLAESACRAIGANPLLARVGAYYHDIGKMDQSEYFIENQTDYNKHLDINPRLSATIIRSHVKQGVEKAHQMRLPHEVIDIIAEHHGNSLISYFYNEAKKKDENIDPEDFMYPGNPPRTKESAVVMLADVVEAACRTLDKPSVPRLEKFIDELIDKKIEANQLDNSDLTFREIEIIKATFVTILAGYYHSRIEYPNQKDPDMPQKAAKDLPSEGKKK